MASDRGGLSPHRTQSLALWGYVGISLALIGAYVAAAGHDLTQSIIYVCSNLAAAVAILVGIRRHRPKRPQGWYWLAAGQAAFLVGNVRWYVVPAAEWPADALPVVCRLGVPGWVRDQCFRGSAVHPGSACWLGPVGLAGRPRRHGDV